MVSGVGLYAMALILQVIFGWSFLLATVISAIFVLLYILLGGLRATMYNEVLQFALIVVGFAPLAWYSVRYCWGKPTHIWAGMQAVDPHRATMDGLGIIFGLGFVLSFGYWCTDFVLVQRGLAARDVTTASGTPLVAAAIKLFFPLLVVVPGIAAAAILPAGLASRFDLALPAMLERYYPHGLLGLGVTAVLASFMSGMAGNISAFNTVWTYDLYQAHVAKGRSDAHYLRVGRIATVVATVLSVGTSFVVLRFNNLMDYVQMLFSIFNAPLFATFLLGMFTGWATPVGALTGLVCGTLASFGALAAVPGRDIEVWQRYDSQLLRRGRRMAGLFCDHHRGQPGNEKEPARGSGVPAARGAGRACAVSRCPCCFPPQAFCWRLFSSTSCLLSGAFGNENQGFDSSGVVAFGFGRTLPKLDHRQ